MGICEYSFNKASEWCESDFIMRKLTNTDNYILLDPDWKKHERQGSIRYGNLFILFRKNYFSIEVTSYRPDTSEIVENMFRETFEDYVKRDLIIVLEFEAKHLSYEQLPIIIKFLELA